MVPAAAPAAADTGIVQDRPDWTSFAQALPTDPAAAAAALERYRREKGLPFFFFLRPGASPSVTSALRKEEDEMGCGELVSAFVRRVPRDHPTLMELWAIEFDSTGRTLRRWPLPGDAGFFEFVRGVAGDEVITAIPNTKTAVYLRIKPTGEYVVSAQPPPALRQEEWIEVAESTFVRVRPSDEGTFTVYGGTTRDGPGRWVPSGDSGWYVRTDSVPGQRSVARAVTRPWSPSPRLVSCPPGMEFEGMVCRGFPEGDREHRIAYPMPCS